MKRGTLYIVAAPSGAGKSSIVNAVLARDAEIALSISFTSRGARPGERHAQHYHFISADEFKAMIRAGDFFEYARVHGDWKGTARQSVEPQLAAGKDVLLEIDWQGARQVRDKVPGAVSVFILPPSREALEQRMRNRGQDSEDVIQQRLAAAREEMSHYGEFDYVIVNDVFDDEALLPHVQEYARNIATFSAPRSLAAMKAQVWTALDEDYSTAFAAADKEDRAAFLQRFGKMAKGRRAVAGDACGRRGIVARKNCTRHPTPTASPSIPTTGTGCSKSSVRAFRSARIATSIFGWCCRMPMSGSSRCGGVQAI